MNHNQDHRGTFLRARDPSLRPVELHRKCLKANFDLSEESIGDEPRIFDINVRVKRCEVADCYNINGNTIRSSCSCSRNQDEAVTTKIFTFNQVFPPETTQLQIFENIVKKKVFDFVNGYNTNLLTFGTSGSGKTYTLVGTDEEPGMIPQSLEYLFGTLKDVEVWPVAKFNTATKRVSWLTQAEQEAEIIRTNDIIEDTAMVKEIAKHRQVYQRMKSRMAHETPAQLVRHNMCVGLWVSCAQIYNEQVFDLLRLDQAHQKSLPIYNNQGASYVKNLTQAYVSCGIEAYLVLQYGLCNVNYASTAINEHSSRSHTIFRITMLQCSEQPSNVYCVNHMTFCDLAGSERVKKTQNVGRRFKESNNINNSLMVLGRCITAVRTAQKSHSAKIMPPFRESKLTQIFQSALQGLEDISMIVHITPEPQMVHETLHSLEFSAIAQEIQIEKIKTKNTLTRKASDDLLMQVNFLQDELRKEKAKTEQSDARLRNELVDKFEKVLAESKQTLRQRYETELQDLRDQLDELRAQSESDAEISQNDTSAIDVDSFEEQVADLSLRTRYSRSLLLQRYETLYDEHNKYKAMHELEKVQFAGAQEEIAELKKDLYKERQNVLWLENALSVMETQLDRSIRHSGALMRQLYENNEDTSSDEG